MRVWFPEEEDMYRLPRQWIANVAYSVIGDEFHKWIANHILERNQKVAKTHNLFINLDPKIAKIFENVQHTSCKYSSLRPYSHFLLAHF